jgi:hypothetical protein
MPLFGRRWARYLGHDWSTATMMWEAAMTIEVPNIIASPNF